MASISKDSNGTRRICFVDSQKRRKSIRLGKLPMTNCRAIKGYIEQILLAQVSGQPIDTETARWITKQPDSLIEKMAKAGLVKPRQSAILETFMAEYIEGRTDLKPLTIIKFNATKDYLIKHFGSGCLMREVTEGDVDEFRRYLGSRKQVTTRSGKKAMAKGMAENTIRKHMQISKQIFEAARRKKLLVENPFDGQKITVRANTERFRFISVEDTEKILKACPDAEWRLIVALARFGGLRVPSEVHELTWNDIDFDSKKITVRSPKTEHHEGKESRMIPMFPEIETALDQLWEQPSTEGKTFVINQHRGDNLRTRFSKIIKRAGVKEWPKPFHNLRSTRETELANEYPIHVVCKWLGNSPNVAMKHYLQMTDEHFEKAVKRPTRKAARKAAQSASELGVNG